MNVTHKNEALHGHYDGEIATLTLEMAGRANKINAAFGTGLKQGLEWALEQGELKGIILATGHKDFCVGADLDVLYAERDPRVIFEGCRALQDLFRQIETCGVPVACALTGSALGGGYELALVGVVVVALRDRDVERSRRDRSVNGLEVMPDFVIRVCCSIEQQAHCLVVSVERGPLQPMVRIGWGAQ